MIVTVSDLERRSFIDNNSGYPDDEVKALDLRSDILERLEDKRKLSMPTWRRHYNNPEDEDFVRQHSFTHSTSC